MLDLTDALRSYLQQTGALLFDQDGQEILAGLTHAESNFIIRYARAPGEVPIAERRLYYQLNELHLKARLRNLQLDAPSLLQ